MSHSGRVSFSTLLVVSSFFFFKQKTAYEMRISDWSSDVCSSDLGPASVLYGAGSSGGLTNMQSKRPQFDFGGSASVSYGTFDRKEATVDITGPLSDTLAARFVGVARDSDSRLDFTRNDRIVAQIGSAHV